MIALNKNQYFYISLVANVVLLIIIGMLLRSCAGNYNESPTMEPSITIKYDTITRTDTAYKPLVGAKKNIRPTYIFNEPQKIYVPDTQNRVLVGEEEGLGKQLSKLLFFYSDTNRNENLTIIINDSIQNSQILSRDITYQDRRPEIIKTITKEVVMPVKKEFPIRAYLGIYGYGNKKADWGVGPSALLTTKIGIGAMYSYDVHNQQHTAGIYYMLKFKK